MTDTPDSTAPVAVRLRGIRKDFGGTTVVHPLDLDIRRGEFFSILGPSGCGKTTLMRMITGFETPTAGAVELDGVDVVRVPTRDRDLNMLFQSYALFPHLSVYENVAFELRVRRTAKAELDGRVRDALALVRLDDFAARKPAELSGGQRQRVALARAVVGRPAVVLLDEPLGALDQKLRKEMQFELKRMQREVGITFIYVTHDQEEALTMSDRIAVMSAGRVLQVASVESGRVMVDGIGAVPTTGAVGRASGDHVVVAVRPERITIAPGAAAVGQLGGILTERVFLGDEWTMHVVVGTVTLTVRVPSGDGARELVSLDPGAPVAVSWPADAGLVLDSEVAA